MYEIKMPKFGLTMEKGYVERWLKKEGDLVKKGDSLLEVSSDKISNEITSPTSGILLKIIAQEGEEYQVGHVIAIIGEKNEQCQPEKYQEQLHKKTPLSIISPDKPPVKETKNTMGNISNIKASPLAKKMAKEYGIILSQVKGSGPGGRITKQDILAFSEQQKKDDFKIEKLSGLRKTIIERLSKSYHNSITLTNSTEVDFTQFRKQTKSLKVSITSGIIFLLCKVLLRLKQFNSHFEKDCLKEYNIVNIGLAVDTEKGLLVPVLKNAHTLDIKDIQENIIDLSNRARTDRVKEDELNNSTFTITNLGMMRTDFFTPILNPPEVAILGIGRIVRKPYIIDEDKITIREMAFLSLSYDHRVIDGADAARFLDILAQHIEKPELIDNKGGE
ncbi:MAG: dihydrolipoamide acetyltransferase family protein [Atribacterota bacterium]